MYLKMLPSDKFFSTRSLYNVSEPLTCRLSLSVIAGDLTLDAGSDPNAVFIFRMPTTFSTAADKKVILAGGANPKNIFWSAGTAATFAARCTMQGNIFAGTAITFAAGCTHHGRYMQIDVAFITP